ncbi:MAG TPA: hypothetical protein VGO69_00345 [Pyrinomonadaceae bacterium]|nr:hypothetical protein [Pyrinomonadaceae bacterium]
MRIKPILFILAVALIALAAQASRAQENRQPSTPEERARAVQLTRALEADPLGKDAKEARRWLLLWLIRVPDIKVTICTDFLAPLYKKDKNNSLDITAQMTFSSAAFMIEHPEQAEDEPAVYLAGLEGSLKAYEALLKAKPKATWPFLDDLIAKRERGELAGYIAGILKTGCKSSQEEKP